MRTRFVSKNLPMAVVLITCIYSDNVQLHKFSNRKCSTASQEIILKLVKKDMK